LQLLHYELPNISEKFDFPFYQCSMRRLLTWKRMWMERSVLQRSAELNNKNVQLIYKEYFWLKILLSIIFLQGISLYRPSDFTVWDLKAGFESR
jgi:hypothetical protein